MSTMKIDPFEYEIFYYKLFNMLCETRDMIRQLSASAIVREVGETAEGYFLPDGQMALLSTGLLLHLNTIPRVIRYMLDNNYGEDIGFNDGDQFLCNDPMVAAMHRMDFVCVAPFFYKGKQLGWIGNYGHIPEIGAVEPGGHPMIATDSYYEGICLVPIKIVERGKVRRDLMDMLARVVRDPRPIEIDTKAKIAGNVRTRENLTKIIDEVGVDFFQEACKQLIADSESQARTIVKRRKPGKYRDRVFTDFYEPGRPGLRVMEVELEITSDGRLIVRTPVISPQTAGSYNAAIPCFEGNVYCLSVSHIFYPVRWNSGIVKTFTTEVPYGSILNADYNAAVNYSTVGTAMQAATCMSNNYSRAAFITGEYKDILAASGHCNTVLLGGIDQFNRPFGKYIMDCVATGGGARHDKDGPDAGVHQINPWISCGDVEPTEAVTPVLQLGRLYSPDTGGFGKFRGGTSVHTVVSFRNTPNIKVGHMGHGKYITAFQGIYGGYPPPATRVKRVLGAELAKSDSNNGMIPHEIYDLDGYPRGKKEDIYCGNKYEPMGVDDLLAVTYWGAAGVGDPLERDPELIAKDLENKLTTLRAARQIYCISIDPNSLKIDMDKTRELRKARIEERLHRGVPGRKYVANLVAARQGKKLPAPAMALIDQLLQTPWSDGFEKELEKEEAFVSNGKPLAKPNGDLEAVLDLTPYVKISKDSSGALFILCSRCGHLYCSAEENFKLYCLIYDEDPANVHADMAPHKDWMIYREFYCPGCGSQVEVEATPPGMPILQNVELDLEFVKRP